MKGTQKITATIIDLLLNILGLQPGEAIMILSSARRQLERM
jgi:hypothetical protein